MTLNEILRSVISRPSLQPFWERLLRLCHAGMNAGGGHSLRSSGEAPALKSVIGLARKSDGLVVFDVGANTGEYANLVSDIAPEALVHCFEPQPELFQILSDRFAGRKKVICKGFALGKSDGRAELYRNTAGDATASLHNSVLLDELSVTHTEVVVRTVDSYCADQGIDAIALLKIDVEGHEFDVLLGAEQMLHNQAISVIQFEFGEASVSTGVYFRSLYDLLSERYQICRVLRHGLFVIRDYRWEYEVFKTTNFIAVLKSLWDRP